MSVLLAILDVAWRALVLVVAIPALFAVVVVLGSLFTDDQFCTCANCCASRSRQAALNTRETR